ncbi:multiple sugar transport system permease protein [Nonomuraea solani]|uniref:Multiple sugar transport system permease protein n=1 Tax=Nonomuraea solani TaxID=1144553 RepID=A0A1H6F1U5_9ACTN|nr:carbohydrate ABC transporter permease [Nonomuraea solani]SEH03179.1 multiple sugar transport system permease protein [Nonomuraea solani]
MSDHVIRRVKLVVSHVALYLVAAAFVSPLVYMVATSFKRADEVFSSPPSLLGSVFRWENYTEALAYLPFGRFVLNGLAVAVIGTIVVLVSSAMSAYAFSRLRWRGRNGVFLVFLATLMIPQEVLVVPMFILMRWFGWVDSFQALIFPWAFTAFGTFMLRQFFLTIPEEMSESARIDGAGSVRIFTSILMPLIRPALAVLAVFTFIGYWNSFLWPLIIINSVDEFGTVPLGLQLFFGQQGSQWNLVMAASVISMAPSAALLILLQKHLIRGIATSGLGGR